MQTDYDVGVAFKRIENEMIDSMMRNIDRHIREQQELGFEWAQWQAEELKSLEEFRKKNQKKYGPQFKEINEKMLEAIELAKERGSSDQEIEILEALRNGHNPGTGATQGVSGSFFGINDSKMDALLKATESDMQRAEYAVLRRANDQYRRIIFDSQVYANMGAATIEKAVDMATKDFLSHGIDSIQYRNGARHTISDYADMALKTAETRAYLMGQGEKRAQYGEHLVIVNKRAGDFPCPHCVPWVGKILIDDVYSGGKPDGKHKTVSEAMAAGFLHPRCRDIFTTYFPGISTEPDPVTKTEAKEAAAAEHHENQQQYAERQADKFGRLAEYSLDPDNKRVYGARAEQWTEKAGQLKGFEPAADIAEAQKYAQKFIEPHFMDSVFKGKADFGGISIDHMNQINEALTEVFEQFPELEKISGIKVVSPKSARGKKAFKDGADALFSYDPIQHGIFINKDVLKDAKSLEEYMKRSQESWDLVMSNLDKLSVSQRVIAERYAIAGRSLVDGDTVKGLFTHELGHHVQWTMLDAKTTNSVTSRIKKYAPKISGYANNSSSEYLAESFVAYMKGERQLLDLEYVEYLDKRLKPGKMIAKKAVPEPVMSFNAVLESNAVKVMREEYAPWVESLTRRELHAIRKYSKNSLKEKATEKFYVRLNAMLRGDIPEDSYLRGYANTISKALKRKPLENDMILFRNLSIDPFADTPVGKVAPGKQFFSTSVVRSRAMEGEYELVIMAPKGTPGAYIERISRVPSQREFLIDKDCKYRVLSRKGKRIMLEVVL